MVKYISCFSGADLLPDYFLDEAENFKAQWLDSKVQASSDAKSPTGKDTPEGVFKLAESLMTAEVVQQVNATFLFVVNGKNPGEH